jgi:hypothetical protein
MIMVRAQPHSILAAKKVALVHVAKRQFGLDDDSYRNILRRYGGAESAAELDEIGFLHVMDYFTALGEICNLFDPPQCRNFFKAAGYEAH